MEKAIKRYFDLRASYDDRVYIGIYNSICRRRLPVLCKFTTVNDAKFVGFANYAKVFTDDLYTHSGIRQPLR